MNTANTFVTRSSNTVLKALAFGLGATLAISLAVSMNAAHAEQQRELRAQIQTLPTVVINVKRATQYSQADIQRLPTVVITGRRAATADDTTVASAQTAATGSAMF